MRYRFAREGIKTKQGTTLLPNSLVWDDTPLTVTWMFGYEAKDVLGRATDIRREEDGWLTAEVEWWRETTWEQVDGVYSGKPVDNTEAEMLLSLDSMEFSIYCNDVFEASPAVIERAHIRALSLIIKVGIWEEQ